MIQSYSRNRIAKIFLGIILLIITLVVFIKPALRLVYPYTYSEEIKKTSQSLEIDEFLVAGVISAESQFEPDAVSSKDAKGLMQIRDETAKWCLETFDIETTDDEVVLNIIIGCTYMRYLIDKYDGNVDTAIAAYNAGEGNVSRWLKEQESSDASLSHIPFDETRNYVERVRNREKIYRFIYG